MLLKLFKKKKKTNLENNYTHKCKTNLESPSPQAGAEPVVAWGGRGPCKKKKKFPSNYEEKINGPPQHWTAGPPTHFSTILPVQP